MLVTEGAAVVKVKESPPTTGLVPEGVTTVTLTVPADSAGEVTVIDVLEFTTRLDPAVAPKFTAVAPVKPLPVTVTEVPPAAGPVCCDRFVTAGP
jgi:hypothetical protein